MKRNLFVSYENFRGRTLTQLVRGYEGRTNPVQLRRFMNDELSLEAVVQYLSAKYPGE